MACSWVLRLARKANRPLRDTQFVQPAESRDLFDAAPALITRGEVTLRINAGRIVAQLRFHAADIFEDLGEIQPAECAKTAEGVRG